MKPFIITIAHQKGGVGKSTLVINLLCELAKDFDAAAIDLDAQKSLMIFNHKREDKLQIQSVETKEDLKSIVNNNQKLLIIDAAGMDSDINRLALLAADLLITPASDSEIELFGLMKFKRVLQEVNKLRDDLKAHIVLNRIHPRASKSIEEVREFVKDSKEFEIFDTIIRDRSDFKRFFKAGKGITETKALTSAAEEIQNLTKEIKTWLR